MRSHRFTKPYNLKNYKFGIVTLVGILSVLGILVVGSAKESLQSDRLAATVSESPSPPVATEAVTKIKISERPR